MIDRVSHLMIVLLMAAAAVVCCSEAAPAQTGPSTTEKTGLILRPRIERALDAWCRWLAGYLYQIPDTDLYALAPTRGGGANPYRCVAGNPFAAAAAGYWLTHAQPEEKIARPLRGLIKLALGTHLAVKAVDRPDIQLWGAGSGFVGDDWHADLFAAAMGMLAHDTLPDEQKDWLRKILAYEADAQITHLAAGLRTRPSLESNRTCGESNAWSAALLQIARFSLRDPARLDAWREAAIQYSLNAICIPEDTTSDQIIAGKPLKERVQGANFHPGGIQEHHGFYHPGYMGWPLAYQAFAETVDRQLPAAERNPDVYLHNYKLVFDRLKQGTLANGRFIHAAGDDWITYGYGNTQFLPACVFTAASFRDPDAARLADEWLKLVELQQSAGDGSVLGARLATMRRLWINDYAWYEAQEGCALAQCLWLLDRLGDNLPAPASEDEYNARNVGTYHEPGSALIWHRDPQRFASVSWRSAFDKYQAVIQPVRRPHLLKYNHNLVGLLELTQTRPDIAVDWYRMEPLPDGGFWSAGCLNRESLPVTHGSPDKRVFPLVRQYQAIVALPEGPTVVVDACQALDQVWLLQTGSLGLRLAADVFNDRQVRIAAAGREQAFGPHPCRDIWHDLQARSITVEGLLTIHALAGEGTFRLLQKRARPADASERLYPNDTFGAEESLLAHELYFGPPACQRPRVLRSGEWFRSCVFVFYCDPAGTPPTPVGTVIGQDACLAVHLPDVGRTVLVNFDAAARTVDSPTGRHSIDPQSVLVLNKRIGL